MVVENEFDYNELPLAYLITVRTYGTWLHGNKQTSVDRHGRNKYGTPRVAASKNLEERMSNNMNAAAFLLNRKQRFCVEQAISGVCNFRGYELMAVNVRTNHFHVVVSAISGPDPVVHAFKSYSTRALRERKLVTREQILRARGKSARYLWKQKNVDAAVEYVQFWQGEDITHFERLMSSLDD